MPRARLLGHVERVTIKPIDRQATRVDPDTEEPFARIARSAQVVLCAQVSDGRRNERQPSQGGPRLPTTFRLTFLTREVRATGWTPQDGDLLTRRVDPKGLVPDQIVNLYLTRIRYSGATRFGPELVICDAVARDPRQPNEGGVG